MCKGTLTIAHCAPEEPGKLAFSCSQLHMALLDTVICDKAQANSSPHLGGCGTIEKSFTFDPVDISALRKHLCIRCSHKPVPIIPAQLSPEHHAPPVKQVWADESFMNMHFATARLGPTSGLYSHRETSPHDDMDLSLSRITEESSLRDDETDDGDATVQPTVPPKSSLPATEPKTRERPTLVVLHKHASGVSTTQQSPEPAVPKKVLEFLAGPPHLWNSVSDDVRFIPERSSPESAATNNQDQEHVGGSSDDSITAQASDGTMTDNQVQEHVGSSNASITTGAEEMVDDASPTAVIDSKMDGETTSNSMPKQSADKQPPQDMTETLKMPKVRDAARQLAMAKSFLLRSSA